MGSMPVAEMAAATLDKCDEALGELHDMCCEPNRIPLYAGTPSGLSTTSAWSPEQTATWSTER